MTTYTHKVRAFDSERGTITVSVHDSDDNQVDLMSVDVPQDEDGLYFVGDDLKTHVEGFVATEFYDKSATIKSAAVCMECENYKPNFFGGSCKLCGCAVRVKITLASQDCPIDKWKKIDVRIS